MARPDQLGVTTSIAVFNAGSTSLKFGLYGLDLAAGLAPICRGSLNGLRTSPVFSASDGEGTPLASRQWESGRAINHQEAIAFIIEWLKPHLAATPPAAVGHRILLGGAKYPQPVRINGDVLDDLDALAAMEPSHQATDVQGARAVGEMFPNLPQVACFDNAFHATRAGVATVYALPKEVRDMGVRPWGFHGLSYDYVSGRIAVLAPKARRVIAAHLGGGASMCAMRDGQSIDTTMGMGALSGLPMATRSGDVPPEVLLYLLRAKRLDAASLERMLYQRSGLLGLSDLSGDITDLESSGDTDAAAAIAHFVYAITKYAGAYVAVLEGLDALVFTGGVGEHSARVRAAVCESLAWLGVELNADANRSNATQISTPRSKISVWVVPTDEELTIARQTAALVASF